MSETFAPPGGPPPSTTTRTGIDADGVPDEPPPAYTPSATQQGHTTLQAGPTRMDFSGPPPMPARLEQNITGVGVGFEPRTNNGHNAFSGMTQQTGSGFGSSNPFDDQNAPALPPRQPSTKPELSSSSSYKSPSGPPPSSSGAGPSRPPPPSRPDLTPTEAPTPGRPLLRNGQMLVYPKDHYCSKCGNTGYKANDPSNPCSSDWRKYGKQYTSALAHSYTISTAPDASTQSASNFQRPLPNHQPAAHSNNSVRPPPPPPGNWNTFPGHGGGSHHFNGPHPGGGYQGGPPGGYPNGPGGGWSQPQMGYGTSHAFVGGLGGVPPNALVVQPGDPRIGGIICRRCGGSGRELDWFGFDDGKCWSCRGLGRVF